MDAGSFLDSVKNGLSHYRWLFQSILSLGIAFIAHVALNLTFQKLSDHFTYIKSWWKQSFITALRVPCIILIWILALSYIADALIRDFYDVKALSLSANARHIAVVLLFSWVLLRWQKQVQNQLLSHVNHDRSYEKATLHIYGRLITLGIIIMGATLVFQIAGVSLQTLLTLGGFGGLAIGIAGRDVLANFFSGFMIYITKPFIIGDWVRSPEKQIEGIVEEIGWYYTCIRAFNKQPLYIPNSIFSQIIIVNPSRMTHWRIDETIGVRYKNFSALRPLIKDIQTMLDAHPDLDPNQDHTVVFDKFGPISLNISVSAYTTAIEKHQIGRIKEDILLKTGEIMANHSLEFAFPTTTLDLIDPIKVQLEDRHG